ncbi:sugar transferase [Sphingobium estronivorans]|uniref:sugar transferase n=1 Tax=Sphingobium estronivorans TaxID=1577690 RepID=UPI0013C31DA0|nr:sugar transferase [Sphingobium estronivorans]
MTVYSSAAPTTQEGSIFGPARLFATTESVRIAVYCTQIVLDFLAVTIAFAAAHVLRTGRVAEADGSAFYFIVVPLFMAASFYARCYGFEALTSTRRAMGRIVGALIITLAVYTLLLFTFKNAQDISRIAFFLGAGLSLIFLIAVRLPVIRLTRKLGSRFYRRILVVDDTPMKGPPYFEVIDASAQGIAPRLDDPFMLHNFSTLVAGADRIVVSCSAERRAQWAMYLKGTGCWGELLVPELIGVSPVNHEADLPVVGVCVSNGPLDLGNRALKRMLDLALTVPAVVLLSPLMILIALWIKIDSRGPILFKQTRMGRSNRLFHVYKFRSMYDESSDHAGVRSASRADDRITRVGRLIRATSIDELPQLFNVIEGDMSLVGPRPHALGSLAGEHLFWHVDERYWLRHTIKPGITGLAQVRGYRGATVRSHDLSQRLQSDLEYVANWSILGDIAILIRTSLVIIHRNAY